MQKRLLEDSDEKSIQKETKKLKELEYSQLLAQKIDILRSEGKTTTNNELENLQELEKSLSEQLGKLKISDAKKLQVKIRRLKNRIEEGSDEEENIQKLEELEKIQFLIDKIESLRLEKKDFIVNTQSNTYGVASVDANKKRIELKLLREYFD